MDHTPVLPGEVADLLAVQEGETVVDATLGSGGHARMFAEAIRGSGTLVGFDVDPKRIETAKRNLEGVSCTVRLVQANFATIGETLASLELHAVDVIFADLGMSSAQLDDPDRGFSFQHDGPLDMRLDPRLKTTAADLVNRLKEKELGDLIYNNAQEMGGRKIARRICEARRDRRITTTARLAAVVARAVGVRDSSSRRSKIHPATRTFQALRIAVNDEFRCLEEFLRDAAGLLKPGGRIGVIAFHSGEDRPVKTDFRKRKQQKIYRIVTARPVIAGEAERRVNPRSRSAKLRVAVRLSGLGETDAPS